MMDVILKRFEEPDEVRVFEKAASNSCMSVE
jgi:hypothetical protein